jgi:hypothetical protein
MALPPPFFRWRSDRRALAEGMEFELVGAIADAPVIALRIDNSGYLASLILARSI